VRARDVRDLFTSVRATAWRAAFFADLVLAISSFLSVTRDLRPQALPLVQRFSNGLAALRAA
jgi:hypothetical protein